MLVTSPLITCCKSYNKQLKKVSMKKFKKVSIALLAILFTFSFGFGNAFAATTPSMGAASTFGVLSSTYTNTTAGTTINGDLGYTTPPAMAPTVNGTTHVADSTYNQAGIDQNAALNNLNGQACTFTFAPGAIDLATDTTHGPIGVYTPGVYCTSGAASIGTAGITLSGNGTYIFRINGALSTVVNSAVTLSGGASACDVFWTPTSATTLGANSTFIGTNIDPAGITIGSTVIRTGRSLAFGGTVTTNADTMTVPSCGAPIVVTPPPTVVPPVIRVTKTPTLLANLSPVGGSVAFNYVVSNAGTIAMSNITVNDNKCSPVAFVSGDTNNNGLLDLTENWNYRCVMNVLTTTTNIVTATGMANGFTVSANATATVVVNPPVVVPAPVVPPAVVVVPTLPKTGFAPHSFWNIIADLFSGLWVQN